MTACTVTAYTAQIPNADLEDLRARLGRVRWPDEVAEAGWDYGVPLVQVRERAARWRDGFDWRAQEKRLNMYPQFLTTIDGQRIHFVHARSPEADAVPLIVTHGWPMSVFEYLDLIGPLSDPRAHGADPTDAFHLVIPSVPGIGFSGPTRGRGWDTTRIARAWVALMARLGYQRYGAHGNDLGSQVSPEVGRHATEQVVGVHVTQLFSFPSGEPAEFADLTEEDQKALGFLEQFTSGGGLAFNQYQSAQPQTLAYSLQDSPVGWLAWVLQLFGDAVDDDAMLTDASVYWLTNTVGSSLRRYYEDAHSAKRAAGATTTPTGVAIFARDFQSVRKFADRDHANIVSWNRYEHGSHFATRDATDLLVSDIRGFFRDLASARLRFRHHATQRPRRLKLAAAVISVPLIFEWVFAPFNLWSGRTLENFVRFTGFQPRVATRLFAPVKLAVAGLLIAGLALPALSVAGAAGTVLISLVYLARLHAPRRRDTAGIVGFALFGLIGAALLTVRLLA